MEKTNLVDGAKLTPSVYYTETLVCSSLQSAWELMLDYKAWNPDFANAEVKLVRGDLATEGEVMLMKLLSANHLVVSEFYAETAKILAPHHIVWYMYPTVGDAFCNFVDFGLTEDPSGVKFSICYYAQNRTPLDELANLRKNTEARLKSLASAFRDYCELQSNRSGR